MRRVLQSATMAGCLMLLAGCGGSEAVGNEPPPGGNPPGNPPVLPPATPPGTPDLGTNASLNGRIPFPGDNAWNVRVDTRGPTISFDRPGVMIAYGHPIALAGTLEPGATLTANGRPVLVSKVGRFRLSWAKRPTGPITLVATDTLRNATTRPIGAEPGSR